MPRSVLRKRIQLNGGLCGSWCCYFVLIASFADEDVNAADRNDGAAIGANSSRNPKLVVGDDREVSGVEDAPDGDGVADACEGGSRLDPCSKRLFPTVGANCRCVFDGSAMRGTSRRGERE